ncbi:MAG: Lyzozyme M1 (1,4-beta-N-acetylmuramidase) [Lawsonibacter sp.]|nr:Lyzozyme M1 (1,4-beta-N-acetylmuramidase) [Lawsonibacter sp.]
MEQLKEKPQQSEDFFTLPPIPPPPPRRVDWSKAAAVLAGAALLISCIALFLVLKPESAPAPEPDTSLPPPAQSSPGPTVQYRDHQLPILEGVAVNQYDKECFGTNKNGWKTYEVDGKSAIYGIDVSAYQENIDWEQVADSGISFAMIRVGYRGYSKGAVMPDKNFVQNIQGALDAGLEVGVYFFSQATSVWEAQEEADYVLDAIRSYDITYPVAFDWEFISGVSDARTNGMKPEEVTRFAGAFCDMIAEAGYTPVIYFNQDLGYLTYQLDQLTDYTFWLAEYNGRPTFYYHFDLWQCSSSVEIPGIPGIDGKPGKVDLNLDFRSVTA